ncbi:MAG: S46 family peptidase [Bacteroidota bacterium]|jgi:hypothetical protein|nr:S46 family peptidase [Bacteroidota bacterium]
MRKRHSVAFILLFLLTISFPLVAQLDGPQRVNGRMWTFDEMPVQYFQEAYGFTPDAAWIDDVQKSALRFGGGCSASFVSPEGLVMTNFHCGLESVGEVTREGENLRVDGFYARTLQEERRVPGLYVDQLMDITDVTADVIAAMKGATDAEAAFAARDQAIAALTTELARDGHRCEIVTLYHGARYAAYIYKRHEDVRLVFSSELQFAFFGGIHDFWAYPRYSFDCDLFRVYENGKPLKTDHYFRWSVAGAAEGEDVYVVGNPGRTNRLSTTDMLAYERDVNMPFLVQLVTDRKEMLDEIVRTDPARGPELFDEIFGIVNAQEAYAGRLIGLRDDELMAKRQAFDDDFRMKLKAKPAAWSTYGDLWSRIRAITEQQRAIAPDLLGLRTGGFGMSAFLAKAGLLVDWVEQMSRDEDERDQRYRGKGADLLARSLVRPVDEDPNFDRKVLARQLKRMKSLLSDDDDVLRAALDGQSCDAAAARLIGGTILTDSAVVARIVARGSLDGIDDALISLARRMLPRNRSAVERAQALTRDVQVLTGELGKAQYDVYGSTIPPDATFTLRISDGVVTGYPYNGTRAPSFTTYYGLYNFHHAFRGSDEAWDAMMGGNAWELPPTWKTPPAGLDLATPINFISTTDIIGGNSGSAIINRKKEVVGLAFDGNIESLAGAYIFAPEKGNRTIGVDSRGILEALRHAYKATRLVEELERGR